MQSTTALLPHPPSHQAHNLQPYRWKHGASAHESTQSTPRALAPDHLSGTPIFAANGRVPGHLVSTHPTKSSICFSNLNSTTNTCNRKASACRQKLKLTTSAFMRTDLERAPYCLFESIQLRSIQLVSPNRISRVSLICLSNFGSSGTSAPNALSPVRICFASGASRPGRAHLRP